MNGFKMPIQRDLYSPENDYQFYSPKNTDQAKSNKHQLQQPIIASTSELENINEIRKLIREQTMLNAKSNASNVKFRVNNSNSDSSDELEVPVRRFTPLPDIPRSDEPYFRTESRLIKNEIKMDKQNESFIPFTKQNSASSITHKQIPFENTLQKNCSVSMKQESKSISGSKNLYENFNTHSLNEAQFNKYCNNKKETRYHFASNATPNKNLNYRLPALEKIINHSIQNTMDLDEDLPMNPVNEPIPNQRQIYTSPGRQNFFTYNKETILKCSGRADKELS